MPPLVTLPAVVVCAVTCQRHSIAARPPPVVEVRRGSDSSLAVGVAVVRQVIFDCSWCPCGCLPAAACRRASSACCGGAVVSRLLAGRWTTRPSARTAECIRSGQQACWSLAFQRQVCQSVDRISASRRQGTRDPPASCRAIIQLPEWRPYRRRRSLLPCCNSHWCRWSHNHRSRRSRNHNSIRCLAAAHLVGSHHAACSTALQSNVFGSQFIPRVLELEEVEAVAWSSFSIFHVATTFLGFMGSPPTPAPTFSAASTAASPQERRTELMRRSLVLASAKRTPTFSIGLVFV